METQSQPISIYVHVPFCEQKCAYCDFFTITDRDGSHPLAPRWLDLAFQELQLWAETSALTHQHSIRSVFFGGGTPSLLQPEQIANFIKLVQQNYRTAPDMEVTLETQPGTLTVESATHFAQAGINRFSVGIQTFQEDLLKVTGRRHTVQQSRDTITYVLQTGRVLSLDLIGALPGQTLSQWQAELEEAISYNPAHISAYELTFHEGTTWHRDLKAGRVDEASEDLRIAMFEETENRLTSAGFEHYEISNYARGGARSIHNENYWKLGNYIGVGAGAHSLIWPDRWLNAGNASAWAESIQLGRLFRKSTNTADSGIFLTENLTMAMRRLDGLNLRWFGTKVGQDLLTPTVTARLNDLANHGLLSLDGDTVTLTCAGQLRADTIAEHLLL